MAGKIKIDDPVQPAPHLSQETDLTGSVKLLLGAIDVGYAIGPNDVIPQLLKYCTGEMSAPLTTVLLSCLIENKWPSI